MGGRGCGSSRLRSGEEAAVWEEVFEAAVKVEDGRGSELNPELEETLGFGEGGRGCVLSKTLSMMFMALLTLLWFGSGVRGGDSRPLTCNDPDGFGADDLSMVLVRAQYARVCGTTLLLDNS